MNLPEILGDRLVRQMNANGDERIDHDEFVLFMLKMLMGTFEQKMLIAFKCYDVDGDEQISQREVQAVLRNIPSVKDEEYERCMDLGNRRSFQKELKEKETDALQIDRLVQTVFDFHHGGMYFDEFCLIAKTVTSEFFIAIYDCIYNYVPCAKNFLILRSHFNEFIK